jgi:probable HAF family extracellular repeat protein
MRPASGSEGGSRWTSGVPHAFIYTDGIGMRDLTKLIDPASGWALSTARGINAAGQICGYSSYNHDGRAYRLTPTP